MAGVTRTQPYNGPVVWDPNKGYYVPAPAPEDSITNQYKVAEQATQQNAEDYSWLTKAYKDLLAKASSVPALGVPQINPVQVTPKTVDYSQSPDLTAALSTLGELSRTGGYTDQGISDLRARAVSPIRAIYAGANRDVDRQRALQGGYSPNYSAVKAKMAREQSSLTGDALTNINASLAQSLANNRLSAAAPYASVAGSENAARTNVSLANAGAVNNANLANAGSANDAAKFNVQMPLEVGKINAGNSSQVLAALEGLRSLYGTTPALTATFGNQALNAAQLQNQITQGNNNTNAGLVTSVSNQLTPQSIYSPSTLRRVYLG